MTTVPVFIEIKKYRNVLDKVDALKAHFIEIQQLVQEVESLRSEEQDHIRATRERLQNMHASLSSVEEEV